MCTGTMQIGQVTFAHITKKLIIVEQRQKTEKT
jgi:hypothetical protein